ncbi:MAG: radical SAM protein [Candidatus Omnitrophica bacterium]|nr:radical SAM protein [Candidatus Omnitrophota bacterium]
MMKKNRVLLVDPPTKTPQSLNIGLGWLAANLTDVCEDVRVLALANIVCPPPEAHQLLQKAVASFHPEIVGINIHCTTYKIALSLVKELRPYFNGLIVVGGPHAVYEQNRILEQGPEIDAVVMGEAEHTFAEICRRERGQYDGIEGVIYRKNDQIIVNLIKVRSREFGALRHPDYRQFGITKILSAYPISTSRGCPFNCCFCNPFMGGKFWRPRPLDDFFKELEYARATFGIKSFVLVEPVFNLQEERVIEFCRQLQERKINLPWYCGSGLRADRLSPKMVRAMKQAGCTHIKIGVESLVPEVFEHVNKGETLQQIREGVKIVKKEKIPLTGSFIIGLPHDTLERARLNFHLSQELGFDYTEWSLLFPYPGTKAYDWMMQHGKIYHTIETAHQVAGDLWDQDFRRPVTVNIACDSPEFPKEDRLTAFWEINTKSGNYIFSLRNSDWVKMKTIAQAIWRYDRKRMFWHAKRILKLLYRRMIMMNKKGERVEFATTAFE